MESTKGGTSKMDKAVTFMASQEFISILTKAHWKLEKNKSELIRDAVMEHLEKHLPKEVKGKILKKGEK